MGSEGQGRAEERGGGRGESYDILWLQPPVPGRRLATPARRGQERAQRGLAHGAARTAPAGASQAGASRSLCFLCQQNTEAAGVGVTPQEPLPAAPHRCASHHAHCLSVPCPPLSLQAGLGLVVPSLLGRAALSVELSAVQPPFLLGRVPGRWMWLSVGWGCVSSQSHFWLHL